MQQNIIAPKLSDLIFKKETTGEWVWMKPVADNKFEMVGPFQFFSDLMESIIEGMAEYPSYDTGPILVDLMKEDRVEWDRAGEFEFIFLEKKYKQVLDTGVDRKDGCGRCAFRPIEDGGQGGCLSIPIGCQEPIAYHWKRVE